MEEKFIKQILMELGIPISFLGFKYIKTAVLLVMQEDIFGITKLYAIVARKHKTTASKVERAIRYSLEKSKAVNYFKVDYKITNKEFIELIKEETIEMLSLVPRNKKVTCKTRENVEK